MSAIIGVFMLVAIVLAAAFKAYRIGELKPFLQGVCYTFGLMAWVAVAAYLLARGSA